MNVARLEDRVAAAVLGMMVVLPLADVVLRATLHTGITGVALIVQHLGLVLGMLGGAIAAREGRLLALSTLGDRTDANLIQTAIIRSMPQAVYQPGNIGHFGLALEHYAHFSHRSGATPTWSCIAACGS